MLGAPYPVSVRLRSNSSPARPRASTASQKSSLEENRGHDPPQPIDLVKRPTTQRSKFKRGSLSTLGPDQQPSSSNPFRIFRSKRPSTAGSCSSSPSQTVGTPGSPELPSPQSRRVKGARRPSSSSGIPDHPSPQQTARMSPTQSSRRRGSSPSPGHGFDPATIKEVSAI